MKAQLFDSKGSKKSQVDLPKVFNTKTREDIVHKFFEASKFTYMQPYSPDPKAGKKHSASGTISHKRHDWKAHYGRGIARLPRKTMWRRGTQFFWVGAEVSNTRGGRKPHPPKGIGKERKINKKEIKLAINSALASTASKDLILKRYETLSDLKDTPIIVTELPKKTKDLKALLEKLFPEAKSLLFKKKTVRAGKGKARGRKYKSNAGLLVLTGKEEKVSFAGLVVKPVNDVTISDLYPLGRLTLYTQAAINELSQEDKK